MKVVVDANVLMSGIFFGGVPGRVIDAWAAGRVEMVLSPEILDEYRRVGSDLAIRYPERAAVLIPVLTLVAVNATIVNAMPLKEQVSTDAADDMFLVSAFTVATSAPALTVSSFYDDAVTSQYTQCTGDESSYGSSGNWIASDIPIPGCLMRPR